MSLTSDASVTEPVFNNQTGKTYSVFCAGITRKIKGKKNSDSIVTAADCTSSYSLCSRFSVPRVVC